MVDEIIVISIIVIIIGLALFYIIKAKKSGRKCIGCPNSKTCSMKNKNNLNCDSCCGCKNKHK